MKRRLISSANEEKSSVEIKKVKSNKRDEDKVTTNNDRSAKMHPSQRKKTISSHGKNRKKPMINSDLESNSSISNQNKMKTLQKRLKRKKSKTITTMDVDISDVTETDPAVNDQFSPLIYIIIDTNIFLDDDELKRIDSILEWHPLPGKNFRRASVVVPWVVLQELDHLKSSSTSAKEARRAVTFLNKRFCSKKPGLRGQTILEAASVIDGLNIEVEDDRILQCCFFFKNLPGRHKTLLFSKDNNLCNKAVVNRIETFSVFAHLVKRIDRVCEANPPDYDRSDRNSSVRSNEKVRKKSSQDFKRKTSRSCSTKSAEKPRRHVSKSELENSIETSLRKSLGFILTKEMIAAYGKDIWLEIVLKKPPWSLKDVLMCIKKHWLAVFSANFDRLLADLVDTNLQFLKSSCSINSTDNAGKEYEKFASHGLELLKGLGKNYKEDEVVITAVEKVQKSLNKLESLQSSKATASAGTKIGLLPSPTCGPSTQTCVERKHCKTPSPRASTSLSTKTSTSFETKKSVSSNSKAANIGCLPMEVHMALENEEDDFSEHNLSTFWESIDKIWSSIIGHCASIFKSLNFQAKSAPPELHSMLVSNTTDEIPHPSVAIKVIPLLSQLINGFILALERFLSMYELAQSSPDLSPCSDLLQTLWTITKAFNLQNRVENVKPSTVFQACLSNEHRSKLINGFSKLQQVFQLLSDCSSHLQFD